MELGVLERTQNRRGRYPSPFPVYCKAISTSGSSLLAPCSLPQAGAEGSRQCHGALSFLTSQLPASTEGAQKVLEDKRSALNSSLVLVEILHLETFPFPLPCLRIKLFTAREWRLPHGYCRTPMRHYSHSTGHKVLHPQQG